MLPTSKAEIVSFSSPRWPTLAGCLFCSFRAVVKHNVCSSAVRALKSRVKSKVLSGIQECILPST